MTAVSDGQLSKAAKLLESPGLAPATASTAAKLKALLVQHEGRQAPPATWITKRHREAAALEPDVFRRAVRSAKTSWKCANSIWLHSTLFECSQLDFASRDAR